MGRDHTGARAVIVSRLEAALAIKPQETVPEVELFEDLARQGLLLKFVIKLDVQPRSTSVDDGVVKSSAKEHQGPDKARQRLLQDWAKEFRQRDEDAASELHDDVRASEDADHELQQQRQHRQRSAGAHGAPLSQRSRDAPLNDVLQVSSSLTHIPINLGEEMDENTMVRSLHYVRIM
jgi:hypothetical protein